MTIAVAHSRSELQPFTGGVLVPTMGALHEGHRALIRQARAHADSAGGAPVVVSVFVNPTQFDEKADFDRYPRTLKTDVVNAAEAGADCVFAPDVDVVYPPDEAIPIGTIPACARDKGLEDAFRPGHFEGVCQVVRRLFVLTRCRAAVFGEKDWQQLQTVRAMSRDERLGVEILAGPTVREADGLALSSRNVHLTPDERVRALAISRGLKAAGRAVTVGEAQRAVRESMAAAGIDVNYATVRNAETLEPLAEELRADELTSPARTLAAGRLGLVRLLDNMPWPLRES